MTYFDAAIRAIEQHDDSVTAWQLYHLTAPLDVVDAVIVTTTGLAWRRLRLEQEQRWADDGGRA